MPSVGRLAVLLWIVAICSASPAAAQDRAEARKTCTWEAADAATVEQITANFRGWEGKCVRVKALHAGNGYATQDRLLADRLAVLEQGEPRLRSIVLNRQAPTGHEPHRPRESAEREVTILEGSDFDDRAAHWCRLRREAGHDDFPIRAEDIDNDPSRPYFCVYATDYVIFREGPVPSASVPRFEYGFLERNE